MYTPTDRENTIAALARGGLNCREIGALMGVSKQRIYQVVTKLRSLGVHAPTPARARNPAPPRAHALTAREELLISHIKAGASYESIGVALGVSRQRVHEMVGRLRRLGVDVPATPFMRRKALKAKLAELG